MSYKIKVKQIDGDVGSNIYQSAVPDGVKSTKVGGAESKDAAQWKTETISQVLDELLFPYQVPVLTFTVNGGNGPFEVGDSLSTSTLTFEWSTANSSNAIPNSVSITDLNAGSQLHTGKPITGSATHTYPSPITFSEPGSYSWKAAGTDSRNNEYSKTVTKTWLWKRYWGTVKNTAISESLIEGLANKELIASVAGQYNFPGGGYRYFAWPSNLGLPTTIKDSNQLGLALATAAEGYSLLTPSGLNYRQISITNQFGKTITYNVFRTKNDLGGSDIVTVT